MAKKLKYFFALILIVIFLISGSIVNTILLLIILYCISKGRTEKRWYNPYFLSLPLPISFLCYSGEFSPLFTPELPLSTQYFILGCIIALLCGYGFMKRACLSPCVTANSDHKFWLIFIVGALPTSIAFVLFGNTLNMTGDELMEAKEGMSIPVLGQLAYFMQASIIVACHKNSTKLIILSVVVSIVMALLTVTKTAILVSMMFLLIGLAQYNPSIKNTRLFKLFAKYSLLLIPAVVLWLFAFNNNSRQEAENSNTDYAFLRDLPNTFSVDNTFTRNIYLNYCYFCTSWTNLNENIKAYGYYRTDGAYTMAQFEKKLGIKSNLPTKKVLNTAFNTFSFITDYYIDFGYLGAIIMSFLLGCVIYFFYRKFGYTNDPLLLSYYALIGFATVMLFFNNHFNNGYLLNYLITFGGYVLVSQLNVKKNGKRTYV